MRRLPFLFALALFLSCENLPTEYQTARYEQYRKKILAYPAVFTNDTLHGGDSLVQSLETKDLATVVRENNFNHRQVEDYLKALSIAAELARVDSLMDNAMKSMTDFDSLTRATDSLFKDSSALLFERVHK